MFYTTDAKVIPALQADAPPVIGEFQHIADAFERTAAALPDAIAALQAGRSPLTYEELDRLSAKLAVRLVAAGAGRGRFVALGASRSMEALIAIVAIIRTGAAYVPIDPAFPDRQIFDVLADVAPVVVLANACMRERLQSYANTAPVLPLEPICADSDTDQAPSTLLRDGSAVDDPIYCMFTSGSTGKPKGVVIPHRGVSRLIIGQDFCTLGADEVILHFAPLQFDASTFEIWAALLNGGTLAIVAEDRPSLDDLAAALREYKVTTAWLTAGLFHLMIDSHLDTLAGLRQVLAGGDVLSPAHVRRFLSAAPQCRLINGYGPTENTTFTACATVGSDQWPSSSVPIGVPIAGTQVFIVDEELKPVNQGTPGQLVTAGAGLATGYLNQPELTAQKFVIAPAPISQRVYLTGDLARVLPNGEVEFLGRMDRQVKIDGKRIEPGEIEQALRACDGIADAAVMVEQTATGVKRLLAFVAVGEHPDEAMSALSERAHLHVRGTLPEYLWPARVLAVESLPITRNGKVDRAALLERMNGPFPVSGVAASELEEQISAIWKATLGLAQVGLDDVFFDLGGRSLQWMQVHAALQDLSGRKIPIPEMFARPTVRLLAAFLREDPEKPMAGVSSGAADAQARAALKRAATARRQRSQVGTGGTCHD